METRPGTDAPHSGGTRRDDLWRMARRLGPLPLSSLGLGPGPALPPDPGLALWEADVADSCWNELGQPDPFTLVEIGAGDGSHAERLLELGPRCLAALRYVLVEDDPKLRYHQAEHVPVGSPSLLLGRLPTREEDDEDGDTHVGTGRGPLVTSLEEAPFLEGTAVVVCLGWLSRLPSDRVEFREGRWWELRIAATASGPGLEQVRVALDDQRAGEVSAAVPEPAEGARYGLFGPAAHWLAEALRIATEGWLVALDRFARSTVALAAGDDAPPLALDQLQPVRRPMSAGDEDVFPGLSAVRWRLG